MNLAKFPHVHQAHLPTPLEPMPRLTKALGGPEIWIKRDDCTGLSTGGNKTRKLEYLMAEDTLEAIDILARAEAILLDPVYSAKGAAGLIDLIRKSHFRKGERVVFLHTGGANGLTGYTHVFDVAGRA